LSFLWIDLLARHDAVSSLRLAGLDAFAHPRLLNLQRNRDTLIVMSDKPPIQVDIGAKAEAKLELKAEVPSTSVGRLVDAFTDIIRPFSEARGLKADLLRVQREEVAFEIAKRARQRIAFEGSDPQPIPNKLLVPLLEKGSCEDISDESMIERWANLLASASLKLAVQPRFVGILEELAGAQAECLDRIAFNRCSEFHYPSRILYDAHLEFAEYHLAKDFEAEMRKFLTREQYVDQALERIIHVFNRPGVMLSAALIVEPNGDIWADYSAETGICDEEDLSVLESLGLIRYVVIDFEIGWKREKRKLRVSIFYHYLTALGLGFLEVCSRPRVSDLEKIDVASRAKDLEEARPY
jgi:hypothetical protein